MGDVAGQPVLTGLSSVCSAKARSLLHCPMQTLLDSDNIGIQKPCFQIRQETLVFFTNLLLAYKEKSQFPLVYCERSLKTAKKNDCRVKKHFVVRGCFILPTIVAKSMAFNHTTLGLIPGLNT